MQGDFYPLKAFTLPTKKKIHLKEINKPKIERVANNISFKFITPRGHDVTFLHFVSKMASLEGGLTFDFWLNLKLDTLFMKQRSEINIFIMKLLITCFTHLATLLFYVAALFTSLLSPRMTVGQLGLIKFRDGKWSTHIRESVPEQNSAKNNCRHLLAVNCEAFRSLFG